MVIAVRKSSAFAIWTTSVVVLVIVAVAGVVITMNNRQTSSGARPTSSHIMQTGGIVFGDAKSNDVSTYIDFLCPICNQFEQAEGSTIRSQVDSDNAELIVHPVAILDGRSHPAGYSSRAGAAMYSVAIHDYAHSYGFMQALFASQPPEGSPGLTNQQIIEIAKTAGVDVTRDLEREILSNRYQKYVQESVLPSGATGTPTVVMNGKQVALTLDSQVDILSHLR